MKSTCEILSQGRLIANVIAVFLGVDIVSLFPPDRRSRRGAVVMARPNDRIVRKLHKTADRSAQGRTVAAGKIGAAAIADEQGVAREQVSLRMQTDAAGGVAGRVNYLEGDGAELQRIFVLENNIGFGVPGGIQRMDQDFCFGQRLQRRIAGGMVGVGVGVDDGFYFEIIFTGLVNYPTNIVAGIDDQGLAGFFAADNVAEIVHISDFELLDDHVILSQPFAAPQPVVDAAMVNF